MTPPPPPPSRIVTTQRNRNKSDVTTFIQNYFVRPTSFECAPGSCQHVHLLNDGMPCDKKLERLIDKQQWHPVFSSSDKVYTIQNRQRMLGSLLRLHKPQVSTYQVVPIHNLPGSNFIRSLAPTSRNFLLHCNF